MVTGLVRGTVLGTIDVALGCSEFLHRFGALARTHVLWCRQISERGALEQRDVETWAPHN